MTAVVPPFDPKYILEQDPYLEPHIPAIHQRYLKYAEWKTSIDKYEGGYDKFSKGYLRFGLHAQPNGDVVYQEWAPNAKEVYLIGDFSESFILTISLRVLNRLRWLG